MSFPTDPLDLRAALFYNDTWNYVTDDVRDASASSGGGVSIKRGRADEASSAEPTQCGLVLASPNGQYNPRVPTSALYGLIGRNTPLQVSVGEPHVGAADGSASASTSHVAPSATAAKAGLLVCAWAASAVANYTVPGSMTKRSETDGTVTTVATATEAVTAGATGTRTATSSVSTTWAAASVVAHGSSVTVQQVLSDVGTDKLTLTTAAGTTAGWWLVAVHYWEWNDGQETAGMPAAPASSEGGWILLADSGDRVVGTRGDRLKVWARRVAAAGAQAEIFHGMHGNATINNHAHLLVLSGVDDWNIRATVEVPSWPQRWDVSGSDGWVPVSGAGILRRLGGKGRAALRSPVHRAIAMLREFPLLSYWPLEDGQAATVFASANSDDAATVVSGELAGGDDDDLPGSSALPTSQSGISVLAMRPKSYVNSSRWRLDFFLRFDLPGATINLLEVDTSGTAALWTLQYVSSTGELVLDIFNESFALLDSGDIAAAGFDGKWLHVALIEVLSGGTVSWSFRVQVVGEDAVEVRSGSFAGTKTGRVETIRAFFHNSLHGSFGHFALWDTSRTSLAYWGADTGWPGETAGARLQRICDEEDVPLVLVGDPDDTAAMGVQRAGALTELLSECGDADLGVLYEPREMLGLAYRTRTSLYNQTALLQLTYGADGEVVPPLHPEPDDLLTVNHLTLTRSSGSKEGGSVTAVKQEGPLSIDDVGKAEDSVLVNILSDLDLPNQAWWRLHLGTVDEDRFPIVSVNLAALGNAGKTALMAAAQAIDAGARLTIDDVPGFIPPDDIDQLAQGYQEHMAQFEWEIAFDCSPASPWQVLQWQAAGSTPDPDAPARFDSDGSTVATSFVAGTGTSLSVAVATGHPLWTTDSGDMPFDIFVSGVRLRVTAISGASSPQTFTVNATPVNGAVKTIPVGEQVRLWASVPWAL